MGKKRKRKEALLDSDAYFERDFDKAFAEAQRESQKFPTLLFSIFLGVSLLLLAIAAVATVLSVRRISKEQAAPGRVVDVVVQRSESSGGVTRFFYPVVEYTTPDGQVRQVEMAGSAPQAYWAGDRVTVLYDPDQPIGSARIQSADSALTFWIVPAITGTLGVIFLVVTLVILRMKPAAPDQSLGGP